MKINSDLANTVINNIFSGSYGIYITGTQGKLYQFSSPNHPISAFETPYDAILKNQSNDYIAVGERLKKACPVTSDRSGSLYFFNSYDLVGTCHGYGQNTLTYYNGYNFYNSFYPMGYISPPFGESISIFNANQDGYLSLENGNCNNLSVTEYNELFGIVSKTTNDASLLSSSLTPNIYSPIYSPAEACPPEVASSTYYDEFQFAQIAGTSTAIGGINAYNGNPIPTSLDNFDIKVNGRYQITTDMSNNIFVVYSNGRPVPSYTVDSQTNKLNNNLCFASLMETKVSAGRGFNGSQIIDAPDIEQGDAGDQVNFLGSDPFHYWQFIFEENAERLPFNDNFKQIDTTVTRIRGIDEGTQLFSPTLSSSDNYWENRQCPATVDFLPWTLGASIYACPSEHFDVPYYAALKKFGFYGARFLNSCKTLNLQYPINTVPNSAELPVSNTNLQLPTGEIEPEDLDKDGGWNFAYYNNLLKVAKAEERYANMYALNKGFFIWANDAYITSSVDYQNLSNNVQFVTNYASLVKKFQNIYANGLSSFISGEPSVTTNLDSNVPTENSNNSDILFTNDEYTYFKKNIDSFLNPSESSSWDAIEKKYSYFISDGNGINENFYQNIISGREKRIRTRYLENIVRGNPIDLYPLNSIPFSFDKAKDYIESTNWGRTETNFGLGSDLPTVNRRYFEGAYGRSSAISNLTDTLNNLANQQTNFYYPGFFQDIRINKQLPSAHYFPAISGKILDTAGRSFSPSGWLGLGYNEVGKLDSDFSCFTPIFIQSPLPKVFCKIGQRPTFRALAVDYHTLPEDKISRKYPEIIYWASKLKLLDCAQNYLYPIKYKWHRILKTSYDSSLSDGSILASSEASNPTGEWACLEGDGPNCTLFHPNESLPLYTTVIPEDQYIFIKGTTKNKDDNYSYFCAVSGRFGVRISNPSEILIEDWLRFDVSLKNGMNVPGNLTMEFEINDIHIPMSDNVSLDSQNGITRTIVMSADKAANYAGFQQDVDATPESVVELKVPPPNAGFGDVKAIRFIGTIGYIGATRSYTPDRLEDTRGTREAYGHFLDYGKLIPLSKNLIQQEGDWLYGYSHLPICNDYRMLAGRKGVKVTAKINGQKVSHWSLMQKATASLDSKAGIQWNKLFNQGELYPPMNGAIDSYNNGFGVGHWQWGNNLGAIKRFGKNSKNVDINLIGAGSFFKNPKTIDDIKKKLIGPSDLAGDNCGYTKYGMGRNMLYYLEAYERFYLICDPIKKKNVSNVSFICPGLRMNNSAIQYFWLGQPSNTYLRRRPMYGPYAYQWQVRRHNRDRNGNGISQSFYSFGYTKPYSLMYDAPATYGLYVKKKNGSNYLKLLNNLYSKQNKITEKYNLSLKDLRSVWFGERGTNGTSQAYGNISYSCDPNGPQYNQDLCDYIEAAKAFATAPNFSDYSCPVDLLAAGNCFDPCLSMRYAQGFFPGGKLLDLFGFGEAGGSNDKIHKNVKIVPMVKNDPIRGISLLDEPIVGNKNLVFRGPINTPHARITQGWTKIDNKKRDGEYVGGIAPCQDGGSEHCNFITPTIHLGVSNFLLGDANTFNFISNYNSNVFKNDASIVGEVS